MSTEISTDKLNEKLYIHEKGKNLRKGTAIAVILIFALFFTSNIYMPEAITGKGEVTKIGQEYAFSENRTYTMLSNEYSEEQGMLELVLEIQNNSFDGNDEYDLTAEVIGGSDKDLELETVMSDTLLTVYRIAGLKPFDEFILYISPSGTFVDDEGIYSSGSGIIVINKYNINVVNRIDTTKTATEYLYDRIVGVITDIDRRIEKNQKKLDDVNNSIDGIMAENEEIKKNMIYMTDTERQTANDTMIGNEQALIDLQKEKVTYEGRLQNLMDEKSSAKERKDELTKMLNEQN